MQRMLSNFGQVILGRHLLGIIALHRALLQKLLRGSVLHFSAQNKDDKVKPMCVILTGPELFWDIMPVEERPLL